MSRLASLLSPGSSPSCLLLGEKYRKSNTPPKPQRSLLGVMHRTCKDVHPEGWFPPPVTPGHPTELGPLPHRDLPVMGHRPASLLASVGLSRGRSQAQKPQVALLFETFLAQIRLTPPSVPAPRSPVPTAHDLCLTSEGLGLQSLPVRAFQ